MGICIGILRMKKGYVIMRPTYIRKVNFGSEWLEAGPPWFELRYWMEVSCQHYIPEDLHLPPEKEL
jgi:hypothetical protein